MVMEDDDEKKTTLAVRMEERGYLEMEEYVLLEGVRD